MDTLIAFVGPWVALSYVCAGIVCLIYPERALKKLRLRSLRKAGQVDEARALRATNARRAVRPEDRPRLRRIRWTGVALLLPCGAFLWLCGLTVAWDGTRPSRVIRDDSPGHALSAAVTAHCAPFVERGDTVGLVVAAVSGTNRAVMTLGRGALSAGTPLDADTLFEIGSITKVFTGIALAKGIQEGRHQLQQPIGPLLSGVDLPGPAREVTLRQLTTHTAGFPRLPGIPPVLDLLSSVFLGGDPYAGIDEARFRSALAGVQLGSTPGTAAEYSNFGAGLLGWILSRQAATNYGAFIRREVLQPLGMTDTSIELSPGQQARFAQGYRATFKLGPLRIALRSDPWCLPDHLAGAGALRSTAADLLKFLEANLRPDESAVGRALRESHRALFQVRAERAVGMNWMRDVDDRPGQTIVWHNGGTGGFRSFLGFTEDGQAGVVILSNGPKLVDDLARSVLRQLSDGRATGGGVTADAPPASSGPPGP